MAHILLIEPDLLLRQTYQAAFEAAGHKVALSSGAQTAIAEADRLAPDVVIMELQLVAHNGLEFLYEFRSYMDWQNTPIIVQSYVPSYQLSSNWQVMSERLGVVDYFYKPTSSIKQLLSAVEAVTIAAV